MDHFQMWADSKGLDISSDPDLDTWHVGEGLIDIYLGEATGGVDRQATLGMDWDVLMAARRKRKKENFGLAGLPGGVRNDVYSPNSYNPVPASTLK